MIKIEYDEEGDILEIRFSESKIENSECLEETGMVVDYDENNYIVGVEILSFTKRVSRGKMAEMAAL
ncbi:DUF2283 domain-containing protein [Candidatus Magnetomonas plexicatena]|uniref:DUF2283 domain-containing protein n=1 Tax=Candidatus Magnetomonas plexicatena TaxID=2552947 RepID=UPI001C78BC1C|nr:DUF2283 domain-containing protein [Nitrospirales bacterium LBB_01]